ncbi:MAG: phosphatase PAP2 family protein [Proteobacteria bacterium]|uniref:Phosphatase PAP2 family protein n=1 Tax=Candidatus Enterousia excrementavium TaxID=2840789 RepID=A0A940DEA4_9PROT|nr:phosphatase PAP2 family protein [Candidatus Enterousia excrementavium]
MFLTSNNKIKWGWLGVGTVVTAGLVVAGIFWFDAPVSGFLRHFNYELWGVFDKIFDAKVWLIVSAVVLLVFYIKKAIKFGVRYKNARNQPSLAAVCNDFMSKVRSSYAFFVLCSVLVASVIGQILKIVIGRARPGFEFGPVVFDHWALSDVYHSMPSGHTFASFAGLVMLGLLAPKIKWFTWTLAIVIGVSRICVGAHWPSDVIFGAFIGMVVADFVKAWLKKHGAEIGR